MSSLGLIVPQATLLIGILALNALYIFGDDQDDQTSWRVQGFVLLLAFCQQLTLYRVGDRVFLTGGLILDGLSQTLSLAVLGLSIVVHFSRRYERAPFSSHGQILSLSCVLLALCSIQNNRFLFGLLALIGMLWSGVATLGSDISGERQQKAIQKGISQGVLFIVVGTFLNLLCFSTFGTTQLDEIRRMLTRPGFDPEALAAVQIMVVFIGASIMGIPPFFSAWGRVRQHSSWSFAVGITGIFAIAGLNVLLRWGVWTFSRPQIGGTSLEPLATINMLEMVRVVSMVALMLIPLIILYTKNLRQGFLTLLLTPLAQSLFLISFGQRVSFGVGIGQVVTMVIIFGLVMTAFIGLKLPQGSTLKNWLGLGRVNPFQVSILLLALGAAVGLAPFFGSLVVENALRINDYSVFVILANVLLGGIYVARLGMLAFQKTTVKVHPPVFLTGREKIWYASQLILLFFMGIFRDPLYISLYEYGNFSVRHFFGDM